MPPGFHPQMEILTQTELRKRFKEILDKIRNGAVFIHPTDTIYGIGCNAQNSKAVRKIRELKEQRQQPFSVWAPSLEWIRENCIVSQEGGKWLKQLPGSYTIILQLRHKAVAEEVNLGEDTLGVRQPDHWFSKVVSKLNLPIVTTSANRTGQPFMTSLENLDEEIKKGIDFMIYEGEKKGRPSKLINMVERTVKER